MWHYVDKNGTRCEEKFTAGQLISDGQVLAEFSNIESNVSNGEEAPTIPADAPLLNKIDLLPLNRALHWRSELRRVGVKIVASKATPDKIKAAAAAPTTGGSK